MDNIVDYSFALIRSLEKYGFTEDLIKIIVRYSIDTCNCTCNVLNCKKLLYANGNHKLNICTECDKIVQKHDIYDRSVELVLSQVNCTPEQALTSLVINKGDIVNSIMDLQY